MKLIEIMEEDTYPFYVLRHRPECRGYTGGYLHDEADVLCKGKDVPVYVRDLEYEATGTLITDEEDCYFVGGEDDNFPEMLFEVNECEGCRPEPFVDPDVNEDDIPF